MCWSIENIEFSFIMVLSKPTIILSMCRKCCEHMHVTFISYRQNCMVILVATTIFLYFLCSLLPQFYRKLKSEGVAFTKSEPVCNISFLTNGLI